MHATRTRLDAQRWHWQHGPIDIVAQADGDAVAVAAAHEAAWARFQTVLTELVAELPRLRQPVRAGGGAPYGGLQGPIARRMGSACAPFAPAFITPMAAVAGSVAQELIAHYQRPGIRRAWLNNGGDIALHLAPGERLRTGVVRDPGQHLFGDGPAGPDGRFDVRAEDPVRGVATSGWRGRSLSLGVADSVTVLAASASQADAAATMIANAVDVEHPGIVRRPACELQDDSDLGELLVTVQVPPLPEALARQALARGGALAQRLQERGLIWAAVLMCQDARLLVQPRGRAGALTADALAA